MRNFIRLALGLSAFGALAACVDETGTGYAPAQSSPFPDVGFSADVSQTAVNACRGAVDAQTEGAVQVVGTEFSQANNVVYMLVGPQQAPWRCLVSNDGRVSEVMFWGSEGAA